MRDFINCPVCDEITYDILWSPDVSENDPTKLFGAVSGIKGTQQIVKCKNCGMKFENPVLSEKEIIEGYSANSDSDTHDTQFQLREKTFVKAFQRLRNYIPAISKESNILDVGCAGGAFISALKKEGFKNASGIEPSRILTNAARKKGLNVRCMTIGSLANESMRYDLISMWDVIEHLSAPSIAVAELHKSLKEGGYLLINYPDFDTPIANIFGKHFWFVASVHIHLFGKLTIRRLLEKNGFTVVKILPHFQTLELGYLFHIGDSLGYPFFKFLEKIVPLFVKKIPITYYASQTSVIASKTS